MVGSLQSADRCACDIGNVFIFHLVEISEHEYQPLLLRKALYGLVQLPLHFVSVEIWVIIDLLDQRIVCVAFSYDEQGLSSERVENLVGRNPVQPCKKPRIPP